MGTLLMRPPANSRTSLDAAWASSVQEDLQRHEDRIYALDSKLDALKEFLAARGKVSMMVVSTSMAMGAAAITGMAVMRLMEFLR